eukprot:jgi/Chlat1/5600/Chrsp369S00858
MAEVAAAGSVAAATVLLPVSFAMCTVLPLAAVALGVVAALVWAYGWRGAWRLRHLPGPPVQWLLGNLNELRKRQYPECHLEWAQKYGPVFRYCPGAGAAVCITDPELVKTVCVRNFKNFHDRAPPPILANPMAFLGLVLSTGKYWESARSAVLPLFHTEKLANYGPVMNRKADQLVKKLAVADEDRKPVPISEWFKEMTLHVIGECAFGIDFAQDGAAMELADATTQIMGSASLNSNPPLSSMVGILAPSLYKPVLYLMRCFKGSQESCVLRAQNTLAEVARRIVEARRGDPNAENMNDFLTMLMRSTNKHAGRPFSTLELQSQAFEFIQAGFETTSNTLSFALYLISKNPAVEKRMLEEIDQVGRDTVPSCDDLDKFPYVECIVKETLRLYPTGAIAIRKAIEATQLGGYAVPAGSVVVIAIYAMHHLEQYFPEPEAFRPERFWPGSDEDKDRPAYTYLPFGAGPRMCIGWKFAMQEAKLALVRLYQKYTFELAKGVSDGPMEYSAGIVMRPKHPLYVNVHPREQRVGPAAEPPASSA